MTATKPPARKDKPRAWQRMLSGRRLDLLNPSPLDVEIEDIAHGLARVARWNGQTRGDHAFSVAQHCVLVERLTSELKPRLAREARLMALLHDASEYVVGDLISPFKAAVGLDYKAFEHRLLAAIHIRFGLPAAAPAELATLIKRADHISRLSRGHAAGRLRKTRSSEILRRAAPGYAHAAPCAAGAVRGPGSVSGTLQPAMSLAGNRHCRHARLARDKEFPACP